MSLSVCRVSLQCGRGHASQTLGMIELQHDLEKRAEGQVKHQACL